MFRFLTIVCRPLKISSIQSSMGCSKIILLGLNHQIHVVHRQILRSVLDKSTYDSTTKISRFESHVVYMEVSPLFRYNQHKWGHLTIFFVSFLSPIKYGRGPDISSEFLVSMTIIIRMMMSSLYDKFLLNNVNITFIKILFKN